MNPDVSVRPQRGRPKGTQHSHSRNTKPYNIVPIQILPAPRLPIINSLGYTRADTTQDIHNFKQDRHIISAQDKAPIRTNVTLSCRQGLHEIGINSRQSSRISQDSKISQDSQTPTKKMVASIRENNISHYYPMESIPIEYFKKPVRGRQPSKAKSPSDPEQAPSFSSALSSVPAPPPTPTWIHPQLQITYQNPMQVGIERTAIDFAPCNQGTKAIRGRPRVHGVEEPIQKSRSTTQSRPTPLANLDPIRPSNTLHNQTQAGIECSQNNLGNNGTKPPRGRPSAPKVPGVEKTIKKALPKTRVQAAPIQSTDLAVDNRDFQGRLNDEGSTTGPDHQATEPTRGRPPASSYEASDIQITKNTSQSLHTISMSQPQYSYLSCPTFPPKSSFSLPYVSAPVRNEPCTKSNSMGVNSGYSSEPQFQNPSWSRSYQRHLLESSNMSSQPQQHYPNQGLQSHIQKISPVSGNSENAISVLLKPNPYMNIQQSKDTQHEYIYRPIDVDSYHIPRAESPDLKLFSLI